MAVSEMMPIRPDRTAAIESARTPPSFDGLDPQQIARLFDAIPDVVFFIKDRHGRYTHANATLVGRLGLKSAQALLGRAVHELFPAALGARFAAQDRRVLAGAEVLDQLELHLYPDRSAGWCLTCKLPLRARGEIVGLIGISRDLGRPDHAHPGFARIAAAIEHLHTHYAESLTVSALARRAGLSIAQFERQLQRVFGLNPRRLLAKVRLDAALTLLAGEQSIAAIAQACGYSDHSAFTRQFRASVGVSPRAYRALQRVG